MTKRKVPLEAVVTLATVSVTVSVSPDARGYDTKIVSGEPKFDTDWAKGALPQTFKIQLGKESNPKGLQSACILVQLRNAPLGSTNYVPNTPPTSVCWKGVISGDTNFVFILPKG